MGNVYLAQHQLIGRNAAIKVLQPQYCRDPEFVSRFFNEARATTQIRHPGIVEVLDYGNHPSGAAYLVMEFLEGETLAARLKRETRLHGWLMSTIVRQMAAALGAAHAAGIVHRDLKPENVFLTPERGAMGGLRVKILDFGVAKVAQTNNPSFTRADSMLGTPHYMSPEQCRGAGGVDWRSDIYAAGCIIFESLTGRKVFHAHGLGELLAMHQRQPAPTLSSIDPSTPPELDYLVARMLAKRPEERPQSFEEVELTLENIAAGYGWDAMWSRTTGSVPVMPVGRMPFPGSPSYGGQLPYPSHAGQFPPGSYAGAVPLAHSQSQPGVVAPIGPGHGSAPTTLARAAAEVGARARPRRTALWVSAAILVLGLGGGGAYLFTRGDRPSPATGEPPPSAAPVASPPRETPATTTPPPASPPPPPATMPASSPEAAPAPVAVPMPSADAPDAAVTAAEVEEAAPAAVEPAVAVPMPPAGEPEATPEPVETPPATSGEPPKPRPRRPRKPAVEL
jgi:serine/threonine-protein kinase